MLSTDWMRPNHIMKGNLFYSKSTDTQGFPGSSVSKESACKEGDPGLIPGLGRSAGEEIGYSLWYSWVFPGGSAGKESACNVGDLRLIPGLGRSSGEENSYPLQYSGLENSMGSQRVGHYWATLDFPSTSDGKASACSEGDLDLIPGLGRCPEKEVATHCSILAWRVSWTEEPGRLQSIALQRVRHGWVTNALI